MVRWTGWLLLVGAALAVAILSGCAPRAQDEAKCKADASGDLQLRTRLAACSAVIKQGASGRRLDVALVQRGDTYRLLSDEPHAIEDFNAALRIDRRDSTALNDRGLSYLNQGKTDLALADFDQAILANPDNGYPFENRGYIEWTGGQFARAIADESRAIELHPQSATSWADRGYAYAGKHWWDWAIADFDDALRLDSQDDFALQGRAESERGKGDAAAAVKDYDEVISNDPHGENALEDANAMIELSAPGDPDALNARCWVRGVLNIQLPAALADCERSLARRPNSAITLDSLALVYFRLGRFNAAVSEYTAALAADPKQVVSQFMRGVAELRAGDQAGGEADIEAAEAADKNVAAQFASYGVKP
jgi:tetratricopeptide (TPR) repeat protein